MDVRLNIEPCKPVMIAAFESDKISWAAVRREKKRGTQLCVLNSGLLSARSRENRSNRTMY
jgi:hypothetical protein